MTHDEIIENYVSKLGISIEEAEQLLKDEEEDNLPDLTAEQKKIVKNVLYLTLLIKIVIFFLINI